MEKILFSRRAGISSNNVMARTTAEKNVRLWLRGHEITSHRDALPVAGGRELRLGRLDRVQRGRKLIGPELLAVSHLTVPLRLLCRRSTRRPEALR